PLLPRPGHSVRLRRLRLWLDDHGHHILQEAYSRGEPHWRRASHRHRRADGERRVDSNDVRPTGGDRTLGPSSLISVRGRLTTRTRARRLRFVSAPTLRAAPHWAFAVGCAGCGGS